MMPTFLCKTYSLIINLHNFYAVNAAISHENGTIAFVL